MTVEIEMHCELPDFSEEIPISKFIPSSNRQRSRDKLLKKKELFVSKTVVTKKQNTYDNETRKLRYWMQYKENETIENMVLDKKTAEQDIFCDKPSCRSSYKCPTGEQNYRNCERRTHFAKVCRLGKVELETSTEEEDDPDEVEPITA